MRTILNWLPAILGALLALCTRAGLVWIGLTGVAVFAGAAGAAVATITSGPTC